MFFIIYDIVRVVGVLKFIVLCVLNKQTNIFLEVCEKVLWVIEELQYQLNKLVCVLIFLGFDVIMVIFICLIKIMVGNLFFFEVLYVIIVKAEEEGFDVIL